MVTLELLRVPMMKGAYVRDGAPQDELGLAEQTRWFVDRVEGVASNVEAR